jgi:WD40 repeat protein
LTPEPTPAWPPLEIVFMQRTSESGPVHLFTHDFASEAKPVPQARDNRGVSTYDWSPDGTHGLAVVAGNPLYLTPGSSARDFGDGFDGVMFAADSATAYAVRATLAGANDRAELLAVDVASGAVRSLHTWTYPHPTTLQESVVQEAQFADDGGLNRVYVLEDGTIAISILGAPAVYTFNPVTGTAGTADHAPTLWSPSRDRRIQLNETGSNTRISMRGLAGEERGALNVTGYVSHVRWAAASNQVVFTLNRATSSGGVTQDLYLWDLKTGSPAVRLTQDQRSLGGEFRGAPENWRL